MPALRHSVDHLSMLATLALIAGSTAVLQDVALAAATSDDVRGLPNISITAHNDRASALSFNGQIFHQSPGAIDNKQVLTFERSSTVMVTWEQPDAGGAGMVSHFAISRTGDRIDQVATTANMVRLRYGTFDPLVQQPAVPNSLRVGAENELFLVQFKGTPLEEMRDEIRALGGTIERFLTDNTHIIRMTAPVRDRISALPYVRWTGDFHPAYRLDEAILADIVFGEVDQEERRYSIELMRSGLEHQQVVADFIKQIGGFVDRTAPMTRRMEATLTLPQVLMLVQRNDISFIDPWGPPGTDMDIARQIGGAVPTLSTAGFTGQGVRGAVVDSEVQMNHPQWNGQEPLIHGPVLNAATHGTSVYGINFATGVVTPQATGMMPQREQGIFGYYNYFFQQGSSRIVYNLESVDPTGPYRVVFQTNSWGNPQVTVYNTFSAEMDDAIHQAQLVVTQSQSNTGNRNSRPEAWGKNVVSVGGVAHQNTLTRSDDARSGASIGPAEDGRTKPDLFHFYDQIYTTSPGSGYTQFGGTSGATPITSGHFGLLHQMWHEAVFDGFGGVASTVFESRPHYALARAIMFASAYRYDSLINVSTFDHLRNIQGWGMVDVGKIHDLREKVFFINGDEPVGNAQTLSFPINVEAGEPELLISMVYSDPPGTVSGAQARINDLDLKVTSPSSVVYWGNNGLRTSNWSTPGGSPNTIDTVENVFIQNPEPGPWIVEVIGSQVVANTYPEPGVQANFGLAVFGGTGGPPAALRLSFPGGLPYLINPDEGYEVSINIVPGSQNIQPGTPTVFYRSGNTGQFDSLPLMHSSGDTYSAIIPGFACGELPQIYFSAQGDLGETVFLPRTAPDFTFSTRSGTIIEESVLEETFPAPWPAGWSGTGLWHINSSCAPGGSQLCGPGPHAYFGRTATCNYNLPTGPAVGALTAPDITLPEVPPIGTVTLQFCYALETQDHPTLDRAELFVNGVTRPEWRIPDVTEAQGFWAEASIDLTEFAGETVSLSWRFNSVNTLSNEFRGWHIANVRVVAEVVGCEDTCYANCDQSTTLPVLNVDDFTCFINAFAAASALPPAQQVSHYANCDGSTAIPVLNVEDFTCFINAFAAGCP